MKLLHIGPWKEAEELPKAHIVLTWFEGGHSVQYPTTMLIFSRMKKGNHYDIPSRGIRYGWWRHSFWFIREDMCLLPVTKTFKPHPYFQGEVV